MDNRDLGGPKVWFCTSQLHMLRGYPSIQSARNQPVIPRASRSNGSTTVVLKLVPLGVHEWPGLMGLVIHEHLEAQPLT